jgi:hypothetical protein
VVDFGNSNPFKEMSSAFAKDDGMHTITEAAGHDGMAMQAFPFSNMLQLLIAVVLQYGFCKHENPCA